MNPPYGNTASVTSTPAAFSCLDANGHPAIWMQIKNRDSSPNSFDISFDGGVTYITRLAPGSSMQIGGSSNLGNRVVVGLMTISTITMVAVDDSGTPAGTATAEITLSSGALS